MYETCKECGISGENLIKLKYNAERIEWICEQCWDKWEVEWKEVAYPILEVSDVQKID